MPDENQTTQDQTTPEPTSPVAQSDAPQDDAPQDNADAASSSDVSATDDSSPIVQPETTEPPTTAEIMQQVADKISDAHNILIALSGDPSIDEIATAIGLSMFLDRLGKRATAIYSGKTPEAIDFLEPSKVFESNPDTLQDFVVAINKDKADHLRYKLDGDFVKVYITPYKTRIDKSDLSFSYGDYNVDLVIALNVPNGVDLDPALREHGRIMHDSSIINITTAKPGKFGEIEWSNTKASSVSEMVADLLSNLSGKIKLEPSEATAFLAGIVIATDHFTKPNNTPSTMQVASKLMESGANQQLINENITSSLDNQFFSFSSSTADATAVSEPTDASSLAIEHSGEESSLSLDDNLSSDAPSADSASLSSAPSPDDATTSLPTLDAASTPEPATPNDALLNELKATEASLSGTGAETVLDSSNQPVPLESIGKEGQTEKILNPSVNFDAAPLAAGTNKYGQMLEDALAEPDITELPPAAPIASEPTLDPSILNPSSSSLDDSSSTPSGNLVGNPATTTAPDIPAVSPEINGVPEMNYSSLTGDDVLPPPPAPPIDLNSPLPDTTPESSPAIPNIPATPPSPVTSEPSTAPEAVPTASDAFQIPTLPTS